MKEALLHKVKTYVDERRTQVGWFDYCICLKGNFIFHTPMIINFSNISAIARKTVRIS